MAKSVSARAKPCGVGRIVLAELAEKPKMGKLQMNWLRSEDLKEEKNLTTPAVIIPVPAPSMPDKEHLQSICAHDGWVNIFESSRCREAPAAWCH